jgi:hypothetical protein
VVWQQKMPHSWRRHQPMPSKQEREEMSLEKETQKTSQIGNIEKLYK